jgi:hypothetical protein
MAILEEEVEIVLSGSNIKYFESLGYVIPKEKDKWERIRTPRGAKILVKVEDLPEKSSVKLTKICDDCGTQIPNQILRCIEKQE